MPQINADATAAERFQVDADQAGPAIKNESGALAVRNDGDTAYSVLRASSPAADDDVSTKGYTDPRDQLSYAWSLAGRVPSSGVRTATIDGVSLASNPFLAPFAGRLDALSCAMNSLDANTYDIEFSVNGVVVYTLTTLTSTRFREAYGITGVTVAQGDRLRIRFNLATGSGQSTFTRATGVFYLVAT